MYLTEDIWYEILFHLPLDPIFKFRCVSKLWLSILSNPNFINKWFKLNSPSLWALVHVGQHNPVTEKVKVSLLCLESHSRFISQHQAGFSFRFLNQKHDLSNTTSLFDGLLIIGSSNGLVLCTTDRIYQKTYYVCNPLTKKWVTLPPPPTKRFYVITGFTCDECSSSLISTSYRVIRVPIYKGTSTFEVDIFSSDLGEWNVYDFLCPPDVSRSFSRSDNLVTHNGVFYWIQKVKSKILAFSVNRNNNNEACGHNCWSINLPERAMDGMHKYPSNCTCLGESEGLVCYAIAKYAERSLSVWVLEEDWYLLHEDIKFYDMIAQMESSLIGVERPVDLIRELEVLGFNPVDKHVVILAYTKYIWAYNVRTRVYEQLSHPSFSSNLSGPPHLGYLTFPLKLRPTIIPPVSW